MPCVFHCAHDLGLKTAAMLHVVASTPNFPLANDCTYYGLVDDVLARPFEIHSGRMTVPEAPGLGIEVDLDEGAQVPGRGLVLRHGPSSSRPRTIAKCPLTARPSGCY